MFSRVVEGADPYRCIEKPFISSPPRCCANNVTAGCKHTPLRSVASLLRKHCPLPTVLPYMQCTPVITYFPSTALSTYPWQPIFIPAQGSSYTTKTVGGEAVRRFFSLKYAVLLYTVSTLFTDPSLRQQNTSGKFLRSFFQKATASPPASPRIPLRPRADLIKVAYDVREDNGGIGAGKVIKRGDVTADGIHNTD